METKTLNLYQKISEITASLGVIQKDSSAPAAMGGYKFISHAMMLGHLRHELTARNVVIIPSGEELLRADVTEKKVEDSKGVRISYNYRTIVKFNFTVVDGDNPQDFFNAYWLGEGMDTSDKGVQKAGTSAEKYFLMKLFKVSDKDDPDAGVTDNTKSETKKTESMSATINSNATPNTEPTVSTYDPPDEKPTIVQMVGSTVVSDDATLHKNQLDALVWFGDQLPPSEGWFKGKIVPMVKMYEMKEAKGTLTAEEKEANGAIKYIFNKIAASHAKVCGEECPHINAAQLAVVLGGRISEK